MSSTASASGSSRGSGLAPTGQLRAAVGSALPDATSGTGAGAATRAMYRGPAQAVVPASSPAPPQGPVKGAATSGQDPTVGNGPVRGVVGNLIAAGGAGPSAGAAAFNCAKRPSITATAAVTRPLAPSPAASASSGGIEPPSSSRGVPTKADEVTNHGSGGPADVARGATGASGCVCELGSGYRLVGGV